MSIVIAPERTFEDYERLVPEVYQAIIALGRAAAASGPEREIVELAKVRTSHINGCAYCTVMHTADARAAGVSQIKLDLLPVWREAGIFSEREVAALAWAEALTLIADGVPEEVDRLARAEFSEVELAGLTAAISVINVWNRIGVAYRIAPDLGDA
jgi:AhpD family alkylhydroperoxidase